MNDLRRRFERFLLKNRDKGIRDLMLYIAIGNVVVYLLSVIDPSKLVYSWLCYSRADIFRGQVWRMVTYVFTYLYEVSGGGFGVLLGLISLFCYYQFGKMLEQHWGKFKFCLYYLTGVVMIDVGALLTGGYASTTYLNLSLFLAIATIMPEARVLVMYIIPVKMKYMAWIYLGMSAVQVVMGMLGGFLRFAWLFHVLTLLNYFLFFGRDILSILPGANRYRRPKAPRQPHAKPNPNWANGYQNKAGQRPYRHKCTVCGKTDTEYPSLEFRYCSRCSGYRCYCMEHINNHAHITED